MDIPVIDIGTIDQETADKCVRTGHDLGFVFVENYGMDRDMYYRMFDTAAGFFSLPDAEKDAVSMHKTGKGQAGYAALQQEILDPAVQKRGDFKEVINFSHALPDRLDQLMNPYLREHEPEKCHEICTRMLRLFAMGLKIDGSQGGVDFFANCHGIDFPSGSTFRWLLYPPLELADEDETDYRAGAHTDYGSITLLFQLANQSGLEICPHHNRYAKAEDRVWYPVPALPAKDDKSAPPLLINIGDLLQFWTRGYLQSTLHRVVMPKTADTNKSRQSMAFFCHPFDQSTLDALSSPFVPSDAKIEPELAKLTAGQHLSNRLKATYL